MRWSLCGAKGDARKCVGQNCVLCKNKFAESWGCLLVPPNPQRGVAENRYVDSFPGKAFKGKVVFISTQAEFTPRNVQTKAERVNTVFAVKLQIANPNLELKPGMPADALLK
jgi:hypothetical protein